MAVRGEKLLRLLEQQMNPDKDGVVGGMRGYTTQVRKMLGIVESDGVDARIDHAAREMAPQDISFGELWHAFKPRAFSQGDLPMAMYRVQIQGLTEAEGHVVMPSHFANISAFSSTVAGLLDAMIMEAYSVPEFKGDNFFTTEDSRMNGGAAIGIMNDGEAGEDLLYGEAYPTVGLKETRVLIPDNKRRGNTIQVNELDFVYDRTGKIQEMSTGAGKAVRRLKEINQAKVFLGIINNYSRDGVTANTYLKTAGFVPTNYVNSLGTLPITGFAQIDTAKMTLLGNRDPGTGFEIDIPTPMQVAVMPQRFLNLQTVAKATEVERRTTDQTVISRAENPLYAIDAVELPMLWFNLLVASGVSVVNATDRWFAGAFKKSFRYRQIVPFESKEAPLSSEDVRRDIVLIRVAREIGVSWVWEPRYTFQGTNEA